MNIAASHLQPAYPSITDITPYTTGKPIDELAREIGIPENDVVKLASNENPLGCSPHISTVLTNQFDTLSRYPDGSGYYLKKAIVAHHASENSELTHDNILLGNGSNDVLDMLTRAFVSHNDHTLFSQYAFAVYWLASKAVGATPIIVPATEEFGHDLTAMQQAISKATKVIFLANPNNPTGTHFSFQSLVSFLNAVPPHIIVVLDEAYVEYFEPNDYQSSVTLLANYPNLVITRTFSKAYGLASMRVGYALASPDIVTIINRIRQPFNVNTIAQLSAITALQDKAFVEKSRALNNQQKLLLEQAFKQLNLTFLPSKANFITVKMGEALDAGNTMYEKLLNKGIITRPLTGYGMGQWLRVSIGTAAENQKFLSALKDVL